MFFHDTLVFSFLLGAVDVGHTTLDNRWFLAISMDGKWLKGKVEKGSVRTEGNRVLR